MDRTLVFPLIRPLVIPATGYPNKGLLVFPPAQFGLTYKVLPDPANKTIRVTLFVIDLQDLTWLFEVKSFTITEMGFPTGVIKNAEDIAQWIKDHGDLTASIDTLNAALVELTLQEQQHIAAGEEVPETLAAAIAVASDKLTSTLEDLNLLGPAPTPDELYINSYDQVIDYFDNRGAITQEGIAWAKNISFGGATIESFVG